MANALCNTAIFNPASQRQYIEFNVPYVSVYNSDVWYHSMGNEKRMRKTSMTVQMMFLDVFFPAVKLGTIHINTSLSAL